MSPMRSFLLVMSLACIRLATVADGPADNRADQVRPIPPIGIGVSPTVTETLSWRCRAIRSQWDTVLTQRGAEQNAKRNRSKDRVDDLADLTSEILVFPRAVEMAIDFGQFYKPAESQLASQLLDEATRRIGIAESGGDWAEIVGLGDGTSQQLIVGGYTSKIDGSYQPYGVVIPKGFRGGDARPRRLDLWFHGRGEKLSEVAFLGKQQTDSGPYAPEDTFVLHPYGRYCNAFKFAGEIDVLEALDYVRERLPVDRQRVSVRGFSMGGAACWQFATHYADRWFAANPGAGFSETPEFLAFFQGEAVRKSAPDYQQTLWQLYDGPPWTINLAHCPTIAYSGEIDRQKQAADVMEQAMSALGIQLTHIIGPDTGHKIDPQSKLEIESRMSSLARTVTGQVPRRIQFTTSTLRYHRMHWVDVRGLAKHWVPARVTATIDQSTLDVSTENVTRIRLNFAAGEWQGNPSGPITVNLNGTELVGPRVNSDRSWTWELARDSDDQWGESTTDAELRKRPGLQGPIDDAFMDSFLFVLPSGQCRDESVQRWVDNESNHAMLHWRKHFRGDVRSRIDTELTDADIAAANLILFGDPDSNAVIREIATELPVKWQETISIGNQSVPRAGHVPALIFPNPLNPDRYVVINSGFTFREYDYLNNARQTPKLPDWALIDIREGATTQLPGIIRAAGFFSENWTPAP